MHLRPTRHVIAFLSRQALGVLAGPLAPFGEDSAIRHAVEEGREEVGEEGVGGGEGGGGGGVGVGRGGVRGGGGVDGGGGFG